MCGHRADEKLEAASAEALDNHWFGGELSKGDHLQPPPADPEASHIHEPHSLPIPTACRLLNPCTENYISLLGLLYHRRLGSLNDRFSSHISGSRDIQNQCSGQFRSCESSLPGCEWSPSREPHPHDFHKLQSPPQTPSPNSVTLRGTAATYTFWRDTVQAIAGYLECISFVVCKTLISFYKNVFMHRGDNLLSS